MRKKESDIKLSKRKRKAPKRRPWPQQEYIFSRSNIFMHHMHTLNHYGLIKMKQGTQEEEIFESVTLNNCNFNWKNIPRAKSTSSAATATAEPLDEPPGIWDGTFGFVGVPQCRFSPVTLKHSGEGGGVSGLVQRPIIAIDIAENHTLSIPTFQTLFPFWDILECLLPFHSYTSFTTCKNSNSSNDSVQFWWDVFSIKLLFMINLMFI